MEIPDKYVTLAYVRESGGEIKLYEKPDTRSKVLTSIPPSTLVGVLEVSSRYTVINLDEDLSKKEDMHHICPAGIVKVQYKKHTGYICDERIVLLDTAGSLHPPMEVMLTGGENLEKIQTYSGGCCDCSGVTYSEYFEEFQFLPDGRFEYVTVFWTLDETEDGDHPPVYLEDYYAGTYVKKEKYLELHVTEKKNIKLEAVPCDGSYWDCPRKILEEKVSKSRKSRPVYLLPLQCRDATGSTAGFWIPEWSANIFVPKGREKLYPIHGEYAGE